MKKGEIVGFYVKRAREKIGASQESLAEHLGTSIRFVSMVERGERKLPLGYFDAVAVFLNADLKELFSAKLMEEMREKKIRQMRDELESDFDVDQKLELEQVRFLRLSEINELVRFYEVKMQDHIAEIKSHCAHRERIKKQIEILSREKSLLGFGQTSMDFE